MSLASWLANCFSQRIHCFEHKFTEIATLTVKGLLQADNLKLTDGFHGSASFNQIELGSDGILDKSIIKVDNWDSLSSWTDEALIISAGDAPSTERDIVKISKNKHKFKDVTLFMSDYETIMNCSDKLKFYDKCKNKFDLPETSEDFDLDFPIYFVTISGFDLNFSSSSFNPCGESICIIASSISKSIRVWGFNRSEIIAQPEAIASKIPVSKSSIFLSE